MGGVNSVIGADIQWAGTTGDYNVPANWSGGAVPGGGDNAVNNTNSTVQILPSDADWAVFDARAGDAPGSPGLYDQSGANVTVNSWFRLATNGATSTGQYNLGGGSLTVHGHFHVGEQGTGTFNQTGGSVICDGTQGGAEVDLGRANGAVGIMNISGGSFLINGTNGGNENLVIGAVNGGTGIVTLTASSGLAGGLINQNETWTGQGTGAVGTLNVNGGNLDANSWLVAGRSGGTGTFNFTSGFVNKNGNGSLDIGENYQTADGQHSTGTMNVSGTATVNAVGETWIGQGGPVNGSTVGAVGVWNMSGGTYNASNWIAISRAGGTGTLNLSGGTITKTGNGNITSSGIGAFSQTGGTLTNTSSETWLAEGGTSMNWTFSAGTETLGALSVGRAGSATAIMTVSGTAALTAGTVSLGVYDSSNGTINLQGGSFTADRIRAGATIIENNAPVEHVSTGTKAFNFTGGKLVVNHYDLGNLNNSGSGILSPGGDGFVGITGIAGAYTQAPTATLAIDIAALGSNDLTTATADSIINGSIAVTLDNGYSPAVGTTYDVFTTTGVLTGVPTLTGPAASQFTVAIVNGNTLELTAGSAVPEPASLAVLGVAAAGLLTRRRQPRSM